MLSLIIIRLYKVFLFISPFLKAHCSTRFLRILMVDFLPPPPCVYSEAPLDFIIAEHLMVFLLGFASIWIWAFKYTSFHCVLIRQRCSLFSHRGEVGAAASCLDILLPRLISANTLVFETLLCSLPLYSMWWMSVLSYAALWIRTIGSVLVDEEAKGIWGAIAH